jgi:hypothetical protein
MGPVRLQLESAGQSLEADAARAGLALACAYSTSDEYDAELIRAWRETALSRWQRQRLYAAAVLIAAAGFAVFLAM